jgi:hypothetical protein
MKYQLGTLEWSVRTRPARTSSDALAIGANIAIRAVLVVVVLFSLWTRPIMDSDVRRFSALSVEAGTPYRDHAVEYAPVELGVIRLIGSGDARATATRLVLVCFLLDLLAFAGMWRGWGRRIAIAYLWLGVPLLVLGYLRTWEEFITSAIRRPTGSQSGSATNTQARRHGETWSRSPAPVSSSALRLVVEEHHARVVGPHVHTPESRVLAKAGE